MQLRINKDRRSWVQDDMVPYPETIERAAINCYIARSRTRGADIDPWLEINGHLCGFYAAEICSIRPTHSAYAEATPEQARTHYHSSRYYDLYKFTAGSCKRDLATGKMLELRTWYLNVEEKTRWRTRNGQVTESTSYKATLIPEGEMEQLYLEGAAANKQLAI
jgi:hypothetical protein